MLSDALRCIELAEGTLKALATSRGPPPGECCEHRGEQPEGRWLRDGDAQTQLRRRRTARARKRHAPEHIKLDPILRAQLTTGQMHELHAVPLPDTLPSPLASTSSAVNKPVKVGTGGLNGEGVSTGAIGKRSEALTDCASSVSFVIAIRAAK